jgi:hypothetical protein
VPKQLQHPLPSKKCKEAIHQLTWVLGCPLPSLASLTLGVADSPHLRNYFYRHTAKINAIYWQKIAHREAYIDELKNILLQEVEGDIAKKKLQDFIQSPSNNGQDRSYGKFLLLKLHDLVRRFPQPLQTLKQLNNIENIENFARALSIDPPNVDQLFFVLENWNTRNF